MLGVILLAALILAALPFVLLGLITSASLWIQAVCNTLAWLLRPLARLIEAYNRLTHRLGFAIGRAIRRIIRKVTRQ